MWELRPFRQQAVHNTDKRGRPWGCLVYKKCRDATWNLAPDSLAGIISTETVVAKDSSLASVI